MALQEIAIDSKKITVASSAKNISKIYLKIYQIILLKVVQTSRI